MTNINDARVRVSAWLGEYTKRHGLHPEEIYSLGLGEGSLTLTTSDLWALVAVPTEAAPWCSKCGCGNDEADFAHLDGCSAKYDVVLKPFLALMSRELHANSSKGDRPGWLQMSRERALLEIYYHVSKLSVAIKNADAAAIAEHSADVANMAMMALDVCGGLPRPYTTCHPRPLGL